jgi:hypothetical protein
MEPCRQTQQVRKIRGNVTDRYDSGDDEDQEAVRLVRVQMSIIPIFKTVSIRIENSK